MLRFGRQALILSGTVSGYPAGQEAGGSGGLWATDLEIDAAVPTGELCAAAESLLGQLEAAMDDVK